MMINRGDPVATGRYAVWIDVDLVPTLICTFLPGTGWLTNRDTPPGGKVTGWLGPLPQKAADASTPIVARRKGPVKPPVVEYDL